MGKATKFTEKYKEIWTFIKFSIAGGLSTVVELGVFWLLDEVVLKKFNVISASFWIFKYSGDGISGLGTMWAFFISTVIGYTIAYIANRKVTFNANNNVLKSSIIYFIMVAVIVCLQSWGGPICKTFLCEHIANQDIASLLSKGILALFSTAISYPMNRFVIQKKVPDDNAVEEKD